MNVVFLDVDGVLNSDTNLVAMYNKTGKRYFGFDFPFDERCMENLVILVRCTKSKIVITSSWRKSKRGMKVLMAKLKEYGLDEEVIACTSILNTSREDEIKTFLKGIDSRLNYIILDDKRNMGDLEQRVIRTDKAHGLTFGDVHLAVRKFELFQK